jgi:hypothetical protein
MKRLPFFQFAASLVMLLSVSSISADLAPRPSTGTAREGKIVLHTSFAIVPDSKAYEARLQISQDSLRTLQAALIDIPANDSLTRRIAQSSGRTLVAAFFLFLSLSIGGVMLFRSENNRNRRALAAVLICAAIVGAAAIITRANAGPPAGYRWRSLPQNLKDGRLTQGSVDIEIMPEGEGLRLLVPLAASSGRKSEE